MSFRSVKVSVLKVKELDEFLWIMDLYERFNILHTRNALSEFKKCGWEVG